MKELKLGVSVVVVVPDIGVRSVIGVGGLAIGVLQRTVLELLILKFTQHFPAFVSVRTKFTTIHTQFTAVASSHTIHRGFVGVLINSLKVLLNSPNLLALRASFPPRIFTYE